MEFITKIVRETYDWVLSLAEHPLALPALAILTFCEAIFFPLPTDPLMMAMGLNRPKKALFYSLFTTVFSIFGAIGAYLLGAYLWESIGPWFFEYVMNEEVFDNVMKKYHNNIFITVFVAGFTPIPFKVFTLAGGVAQVAFVPFVTAAALSRGLRFLILGGLIYYMGEAAKDWIEKHFNKLSIVVALGVILMASMTMLMRG